MSSKNKVLDISSLTSTGEGVGSDEGLKVFVEGALPTERVEIEITERKKRYARGKLLKILHPSEMRTQPICPYFGTCGGCQIMHLQYPAQLKLKRRRVIDALERIGGLENLTVAPCIPSPTSLGYRNKIQLPVIWEGAKKKIGLYRKHTHEIIPIESCAIQCPEGEEILKEISKHLTIPSVRYVLIRNAIFNNEALVLFITDGSEPEALKPLASHLTEMFPKVKGVLENINRGQTNVILGRSFHLLAGRSHIYERLLDRVFKISPAAFFQINPAQTEHLYTQALASAELTPETRALDAYCGVGTLALLAAENAKEVVGIECIPQAIEDAKENARLNGIENAHFFCGRAEDKIGTLTPFDVVFLNPPRKGCAESLLSALFLKKPRRIVYISCDPATLARDLKTLSAQYHIDTIQPFDMFPQTMHVETLVSLSH